MTRGLPWAKVEWFWPSLEMSFGRPSCPPFQGQVIWVVAFVLKRSFGLFMMFSFG
jgi:hypothetical protein